MIFSRETKKQLEHQLAVSCSCMLRKAVILSPWKLIHVDEWLTFHDSQHGPIGAWAMKSKEQQLTGFQSFSQTECNKNLEITI